MISLGTVNINGWRRKWHIVENVLLSRQFGETKLTNKFIIKLKNFSIHRKENADNQGIREIRRTADTLYESIHSAEITLPAHLQHHVVASAKVHTTIGVFKSPCMM